MSELSEPALHRLARSMAQPNLPPRYVLDAIIGRGGMAVVWRAHDRILEREVAIKVLAEHLDDAAVAARLAREARILARLEHPGIVSVHDSGVLDDGRPWYAMRLVRGARLDEAAASFATIGDALRVMLRLVETIAFANAQGVLHRDLTPRNVMLGPFGEVLALDWGVAGESGREESGTVMGTPGYMAPEQAAGLEVDVRSDVYGLGAILRDLLGARSESPPPPLTAIVYRAMAQEPSARYPTALALRDDLVRYLDGAKVAAYHESRLEAILRLSRPYRTLILLVLSYLAMRVAVFWWRGL